MKKLNIIMWCILNITIISCEKETLIQKKEYQVKNPYLAHYVHLQQREGESAWTNYVLLAGAIYKSQGIKYEVTYKEIEFVKKYCKNNPSLELLQKYAQKYNPELCCRFETDCDSVFFENHLPCIIAIEEGNQHLIVWDIDEKRRVYYTDSRLSTGKIQNLSFEEVLEKAKPEFQFLYMCKKN